VAESGGASDGTSVETVPGPPLGCRSPAAGVLTRYPPVELYAYNTCAFALKARHFFEHNRIPFQFFDVAVDRDANARMDSLVRSTAVKPGIPFVLIGSTGVSGFRPDAYWKALCTEPPDR
jgi:hypothetical protein